MSNPADVEHIICRFLDTLDRFGITSDRSDEYNFIDETNLYNRIEHLSIHRRDNGKSI